MTTMDLKSISWLGDMYQRFESLCVEAEENMYHDTVKYVEDQMRTVGASVKKFYSDVMHDLLPQSSLDTVKEENPILNAVTKKPEVINEKKSVNTEAEQMINDFANADNGDNIANYEPSFHDNVEEQCVNKDFQSRCAELDLPNLDICLAKDLDNREDSECKSSPSDTSNLNPSMTKEFTYSEVRNESNEPLSQLVDVSSESASVIEVSFNEDGVGIAKQMTEGKVCVGVVNGSETTAPSSRNRLPDFDVSSTGDDVEITFTIDAQSSEGVDLDLFVSDTGIRLHTSVPPNPMLAGASSSEQRHWVNVDVEAINPSRTSNADKQEVLLIKQLDKVDKLGESCVLVETFAVPHKHKQRSYKKIRDVVTPRRWSKGKKDEEQHSVWYKEQDGKDSVTTILTRASIQDNSALCESFESEWELL